MARLITPEEQELLEFEMTLIRQFSRLHEVARRHMKHMSTARYHIAIEEILQDAIGHKNTFDPHKETAAHWFERFVIKAMLKRRRKGR